MSLATLRTRAREFLEDTNSSAYQWTSALINQYLDDGAAVFARETRCYKKRSSALSEMSGSSPDNAWYALPTDFYELLKAENAATWLRPVSVADLPDGWNTDTGTPYGYIPPGALSLTDLRLYPYPSAASTTLFITYVALPAAMGSTDGNNPTGIPTVYQNALVYWAVAKCLQRNFEEGDPGKSAVFMAMYQDLVRQCRASVARDVSGVPAVVPYRHL